MESEMKCLTLSVIMTRDDCGFERFDQPALEVTWPCRSHCHDGIRGVKAATRYPHLVLDELCAIRGIVKARDGYLPNPTASLLPQHFFS